MATEGENEIETTTMKNNDGGENVTEDAKNDVVEDDDIKETAKEEEQDETIVSHKNVELAEEANAKAEGLKERLRLFKYKQYTLSISHGCFLFSSGIFMF